MKKSVQVIDYSVDVSSGAYGLANIQTILGIVLLILSIASILYKMGLSIYNHYKKKEYKEIAQDIDKAITEVKNEIDKVKEDGK